MGVHGKINNRKIFMKIDTGSDVNIIDEAMYGRINDTVKLMKPKIKLLGYNSNTPLTTIGKFSETLEVRKRICVAEFYVVTGRSGSLINAETAEVLGLIKFTKTIMTKNSIISQYPEVFNGIGKMKGEKVKLHIDKNVDPVVQPYRRIPLAMREKVGKEQTRLENADVIEKVCGPTEWISPIVIQMKRGSDDIGLCVDMRLANKAITRTRHIIPTIEEVRHSLNGAKHFSKFDLKNGYHQLELHSESRYYHIYNTQGVI